MVDRVIIQKFSNNQILAENLFACIWKDCEFIGRINNWSDHLYYEPQNGWGVTFDGCWFDGIGSGKFAIKTNCLSLKVLRTAFSCDLANPSVGGGISIYGNAGGYGGAIVDSCDFEHLGLNQPAISLDSGWCSLVTRNNVMWGGATYGGAHSGPYPFIRVTATGASSVASIICEEGNGNWGGGPYGINGL